MDEESKQAPRRLPEATGECIVIRTISDWQALDAYTLLIRRGTADDDRIIELLHRCHSIKNVDALNFSSNDGQICDYRNDVIVAETEHCIIGAITKRSEAPNTSPD